MTQFLQNYWMYSIIFVLSLWVLNRTWYYWSLTPSFASKVVLITGWSNSSGLGFEFSDAHPFNCLIGFWSFDFPGGGSGIGRRMAVKFADLKATVLVWDIFEDGMKQTSASSPPPSASKLCKLVFRHFIRFHVWYFCDYRQSKRSSRPVASAVVTLSTSPTRFVWKIC